MADLSKIKLNNSNYNIKDAWARSNLQTSTQVNSLIASALGNISSFEISVVQSLPSTGENGTFYFVPNNHSTNNVYDEYVYVNGAWELIGSTSVDLSNYLKTTDISAWAKASSKPSYTASEVGALSSNTTYVSTFNGQSGAITYIPPVSSVNGQTGVVTITLPVDVSELNNDVGYLTLATLPKYDGTVV